MNNAIIICTLIGIIMITIGHFISSNGSADDAMGAGFIALPGVALLMVAGLLFLIKIIKNNW